MKRIITTVLVVSLLILTFTSVYADSVPQEVISHIDSVFYIQTESKGYIYSGTGFLIQNDSEGSFLLTNAHVIEDGPNNITVWLNDRDTCRAFVEASSKEYDLALLKLSIDITNEPLTLSTNAQLGDAVYAVGFPGAADYLSDTQARSSEEITLTDGVVSAIRNLTMIEDGRAIQLLQINADINAGNSGGPLFNRDGCVVGVNTYGVTDASGINGAISVNSVVAFLKEVDAIYGVSFEAEESNSIETETTELEIPETILATEPVALPNNVADLTVIEESEGSSFHTWYYVAGGILLALAAYILIYFLKQKAKKSNKKEKTLVLSNYLLSIHTPLTEEDVGTLFAPLAKQLRDKHADGQLHLHLCPAAICVSKKGCSINEEYKPGAFIDSRYAAPEQLAQYGISVKSDIYSLCQVLKSLWSAGRADDCTDNSSVINSIVSKGTASQPTDRYNSMQDLIYDLACINSGELSIAALSPFSASEENKSTKTRRVPVLIAAAAAVVLLVVSFVLNQTITKHNIEVYAKERNWDMLQTNYSEHFFPSKSIKRYNTYCNAGKKYLAKDYDRAIELLSAIPELEYTQSLLKECMYEKATILMGKGEYREAAELYKGTDSYNAAATDLRYKCLTQYVAQLMDAAEYKKAIEMIDSIIQEYGDSKDVNPMNYQKGCALKAIEEYSEAHDIFEQISSYENAQAMAQDCLLLQAEEYIENGEFDSAISIYKSLGTYRHSDNKLQSARYRKAWDLVNNARAESDYLDAIAIFETLENVKYEGATDSKIDAMVALGRYKINTGDYIGAFDLLENVKNKYSDARKVFDEAQDKVYEIAVTYYHNGDIENALILFERMYPQKETKKYLTLLYARPEAHKYSKCNKPGVQYGYDAILAIAGFEDASEILESMPEFKYKSIEGTWYACNTGYNHYISIHESINLNYHHPYKGTDYDIKDGVLYIKGEAIGEITVITSSSMKILWYDTGKADSFIKR